MARCLIGCGSNLGQRREQLDRALELLRFMPGVELVAVSRYLETHPVGGPPGQGCFLNGACLIETNLPPHDLLGALFAVENTLARRRDDRWGERSIDLDLLLYDDLVVESPALTLPHPRMATRRFVLEPSVEIAAELPYPPGNCTVRELLDNISVPHPLVAVVGVPGSGAPVVATAVADATLARLVRAPMPLPLAAEATTRCEPTDAGGRSGPTCRWLAAVEAWQRPLRACDWQDDPHGTITDYWLDALPAAAAARLPESEWPGFERGFERLAAAAIAPQVAIFLRVSRGELRQRLAFRDRQAGSHSDVFAEMPAVSPANLDEQSAVLAQWQDRLERRLRCPPERCPRAPKAVVTIAADDLAAAVAEATAAVEAML